MKIFYNNEDFWSIFFCVGTLNQMWSGMPIRILVSMYGAVSRMQRNAEEGSSVNLLLDCREHIRKSVSQDNCTMWWHITFHRYGHGKPVRVWQWTFPKACQLLLAFPMALTIIRKIFDFFAGSPPVSPEPNASDHDHHDRHGDKFQLEQVEPRAHLGPVSWVVDSECQVKQDDPQATAQSTPMKTPLTANTPVQHSSDGPEVIDYSDKPVIFRQILRLLLLQLVTTVLQSDSQKGNPISPRLGLGCTHKSKEENRSFESIASALSISTGPRLPNHAARRAQVQVENDSHVHLNFNLNVDSSCL